MVDYKLLADNDPSGDLETAFAAMSAETVTTHPQTMITYRKIGGQVSLSASAELESGVTGSVSIPSWVDKALSTDGIDVNNPQVAAVIGSLVSAETAAAILALGDIVEPRYKGLKIEQLEKARQLRQEGKV